VYAITAPGGRSEIQSHDVVQEMFITESRKKLNFEKKPFELKIIRSFKEKVNGRLSVNSDNSSQLSATKRKCGLEYLWVVKSPNKKYMPQGNV
jgi:hypothetical protein